MADQKKRHEVGEKELVEIEPVKEIEIETKDIVATSKLWIYIIIGLLVYMMFFIISHNYLISFQLRLTSWLFVVETI